MIKKNAGLRHPNMPLLLLQGRERVMARFRPLLNEHDITEQQWRIIRVLLDTSPLEPREIGELCGISSPSMAGVLERMEQVDLISKRRLKHDQRRVHVALTPRSRKLAERLAPAINEAYERIETQVGKELWTRVQKTLEELVAALPPELPQAVSESSVDVGAVAVRSVR